MSQPEFVELKGPHHGYGVFSENFIETIFQTLF